MMCFAIVTCLLICRATPSSAIMACIIHVISGGDFFNFDCFCEPGERKRRGESNNETSDVTLHKDGTFILASSSIVQLIGDKILIDAICRARNESFN